MSRSKMHLTMQMRPYGYGVVQKARRLTARIRRQPVPKGHTGSGAAFNRSMLNRLLTLRSGTAAISLR